MVLVARCSTVSVPASEHHWLTEKCDSTFTEDFDVLCTIGRGRFAKVCRVRHRTSGDSFAAKIIRRWRNGKDTIDTIANELRVLELGNRSPHITSVHQCYVRNQDVVIVLEHAVGGDLYHLIHYSDVSPPVDFVRSIVRQVLKAVSFLHEHNVVHLDIKVGSSATVLSPAPEILDYNPIQLTTDIWSIGVLTYYLLTGTSPFWAPNKEETFNNVTQMRISFPDDLFQNVPIDAVNFIRRNRPSALDCFSDDWFMDSSTNVCPSDASALIDSTPDHSLVPEIGSQQSPSTKCELTRPELDRSFGEC
ncbi:hypothetical protein EG68_03191 [Paragonimus skrjabini miyazakii]|uniref:Protein kinase domain-containing protein n=1 Tax=Paragonimus skrjabini miyazakii TaxID=59628 RepID=A0A8S9YTG3_9TREM|nr:hypothetical protein EG68_03191 [Paragonimus skrjabini miyazakii]